MILSEQFIKSIPTGYKEKVLEKLSDFQTVLIKSENQIRKLPVGYWVRAVKNTNVFKFRLNNKDRILYTYINKREDNTSEVVFLKYVNHDEQIREARNIDLDKISTISIDIDKNEYTEENNNDSNIYEYVNKYCSNGYIDMSLIPSMIVNEDELIEVANNKWDDYLYYLSDEQYNIIKSLDGTLLLSGGGGSGKTIVMLNLLMLAKENGNKALYTTDNSLLIDYIKSTYYKTIDDKISNCDILSVKELANSITLKKVVDIKEIISWVQCNKGSYKNLKNRDTYEIATELNGVIKGYLGLEILERDEFEKRDLKKISLSKYLDISGDYSNFNGEEKISMYKLAEEYDRWLLENGYCDGNDIARLMIMDENGKGRYDWVLIDEVQDLSEVQTFMLSKLVKENGYIIWSGDINQAINPTFFNYGRIKNLYYYKDKAIRESSLTKNYRTNKEIVELINEINNFKISLIGKNNSYNKQIAIREGAKPNLLQFEKGGIDKLIKDLSDKHYSVIVVANEEVKRDLISKHPEIESRLFLVHEIKGLEYENIVCYNIISTYKSIWNKIINGKCKNNEYMKYYFNLIYVAISRAKDYLNIYEDSMGELEFSPFDKCEIITEYDKYKLGFDKESTDVQWDMEANRLEKIGEVEKAKLIRDFKMEESLKNINSIIDESFSNMYKDISKEFKCENDFEERLKEGIIKYRERNYTEALSIFNEMYDRYSKEDQLIYYMAMCYCYMTDGKVYSLRYFWEAIRLNPYKYEYYLDMAAVLKTMEFYTATIEILELAEMLAPKYGNSDEIKANLFLDLNNEEKARMYQMKSSNKPKYRYDSYNKCWIKPYSELKGYKDEESLKNYNKSIRTLEGIEYLNIKENKIQDKCLNEIAFKDVAFNKKHKRYLILLDIEKCNSCDNYRVCIASKADKQNKLSIKETSVKNYQKLNCINDESLDKNDKLIESINAISEVYGENFQRLYENGYFELLYRR